VTLCNDCLQSTDMADLCGGVDICAIVKQKPNHIHLTKMTRCMQRGITSLQTYTLIPK